MLAGNTGVDCRTLYIVYLQLIPPPGKRLTRTAVLLHQQDAGDQPAEHQEYIEDKEETKFHKICFSKFYEVFPRQVGKWIMRELEYYASHNPAKVDYEEEHHAHHDRG